MSPSERPLLAQYRFQFMAKHHRHRVRPDFRDVDQHRGKARYDDDVQQRREWMNRQINERLKALIAAYKALGGSLTGTLTVDPTHLRDLKLKGRRTG
jgi:hypothetical protein